MKNKLLLITFLFSVSGFGQKIAIDKSNKRHKNLYANLLGADLLAGVHYDMRFLPGRQDGPGFSTGIGGGVATIFLTNTTVLMIPVEFNYVIGTGNNSLVLGGGIVNMKYSSETILIPDSKTSESSSSPLLSISYRRQPINNGFFFQVGLQFTSFDKELPSPIPFSIGFGYGFK